MPHDRFVSPDSVLLQLSDEDWIMVKKRLNIGELRKAEAASLMLHDDGTDRCDHCGRSGEGKRWIPDPERMGIADVAIYLVDWSQSVSIRQAPLADVITALQQLDPEDFMEIRAAIHIHERTQQAARDAEKKTRTTAKPSALISNLPDTTDGPSIKSDNLIQMTTP